MSEGYIKLGDVFVYKIAIELCDLGWKVYQKTIQYFSQSNQQYSLSP